jgi:putative peptide zinc metalloprotease protein
MDRPTFSESWSRVSRLSPTLRPQVQITRRLFQGQPWHVVHDPISNNFFRLNPAAYHFVGLLDGQRTVDEVWRLTLERFGDAAPTQNEVIGLLSQLNESNLLRVDVPPDAEPLLRRRQKRTLRHWAGQASSILFLRIPLFNPDRLLSWLLPFFRPFLNRWCLIAWVLWVGFVTAQFLPHASEFVGDAQSVLAPSNWLWMILVFTLIKAWHELGHGLVCKRLGGAVPEVGVMTLVLFPVPYVDATTSWNFPDRWRRMLVGAAGMIFELAAAGVAALLWLHAEPGSTLRQLSYNATFMASVATVLFNANPLLRFDGYYMLSDLLEVPNLYDRATRHLQWLVQRYVFGMTNVQPVTSRRRERAILAVFGVSSQVYRFLVLAGIILFIAGKFFAIGVILAAWSLLAWLLFPLAKFLHWLVTSPALHEHRARAAVSSLLGAALTLAVIGAVPMPDHRRAAGVVEGADRLDLAIQTEGFVTQVLVETGDYVRPGQVILTADNPQLRAEHEERAALLKRLRLEHFEAVATDQVKANVATAQIQAVQEEITEIEQRLDKLVLRSPRQGILVGGLMQQWVGQYLKSGKVVAQIVDLQTVRVTALVDQAHAALMFDAGNRIRTVELRSDCRPDQVIVSQLLQAFPSGRTELPHPALGYAAGGQIATNPDDPKGSKAMRPQFELWLELPQVSGPQSHVLYPGQRVSVRLTLEHKRPLLQQWTHRLRQLLRERLAV